MNDKTTYRMTTLDYTKRHHLNLIPGFILMVILLLGSTGLYAQQGNASNFSIYGDLYSGYPTPQSTYSDDWFQGWITITDPSTGVSTRVRTAGNGMIDESQATKFYDSTYAKRNNAFTARSPYDQYKELNGFLLYDAVYGRDHVNFGSATGGRDKSAFKGSSGKYTDPPSSAWDLGTDETISGSFDLVDVYAHLRRQGVTVGSNMWLMLGASTFDVTGEHYVDFELYASPIALNADKSKFINSGPANKGGHTPWTFDASGNVTASGDMLAGFKFYNNFVDDVELKIWVSKNTYDNINPVNFNFINFDAGNQNHGYATIEMITSDVKSSAVGLSGVKGPPWGTFRNGPGDPYVTTYAYGSFAEVGINLSTLGLDPSLSTGNPCDAPFTKLLVKSKSSNSLNATLKDFAGPYNFLGSSVVDTQIAKSKPAFNCTVNSIDLSPKNPQSGSYYYWSTVDGEFSNGTKMVVGENATATMPGTYRLAAAPLEGCTESFDEIRIYAEPCANDDTVKTPQNKSIIIDVLANDEDLDGDLDPTSVTKASLEQAKNGTVVINPSTGSISYTPDPNFYGVDYFQYKVFDETPNGTPHHGPYSDIALVTVYVQKDTDGDEVADVDDLDDDNDGIPDTMEFQCAPKPNLILNPDFESPNITSSGLDGGPSDVVPTYRVWKGEDTNIPNWISADNATHYLELWQNDYDNSNEIDEGYGAASGTQFVEVTASSPLGLYQDFITNPGDVLRVSFAHRNRSGENDIIDVLMGPPGSATLQTRKTSDPDFKWKEHVGYYTVPENQTRTRIWFRSNFGSNFIDNVQVTVVDACYDFDGDHIPNHLDLDSDNDGIPDVREAGLIDTNNDGLVDTNDYGNNGLANNVETSPDSGIINYTILNTDAATDVDPGFNLYDFLDLDSDNDGLSDTTEAFSNNPSYNDYKSDGKIDGFVDTNRNGWHDAIDDETTFPGPVNSDYDALPDYRDLDSDGDGIPDTREANFDAPDTDFDGIVGTGIPADDNANGLANSNDIYFADNVIGGTGFNNDFDNDGLANHLDIDSDNDGIVDNTEGQGTFSYIAPDFEDTDGDGIDDAYDVNNGGSGIGKINTDSDTYPDYLDPNTDDDGEWDLVENHFNNGPNDQPSDVALDVNNNVTGNGRPDGMVDPGTDADGDGLADIFENVSGTNNQDNSTNGGQNAMTQPDLEFPGNDRDWREIVRNDIDNDGISDLNDLDDDNDGILDIVEGGGDADGDGVPFYLDENDNDDTILASNEPNILNDIDGDGLQNSFDLDSDGDGIPDHIEASSLLKNKDQDGNGMPGTGLLTSAEVDAQGVPLLVTNTSPYDYGRYGVDPLDTDGDGYYDFMDLDSDNDGISDVIEAGGIDTDGNGKFGTGNGSDVDVDGLNDALDTVSNNDNPDTNFNELGIPMSGTPLTLDSNGAHRVKDSDNDSIPDNLDLDSDNDTVPDNIEAQTTVGYVPFTATDTDKDGIVDNYDINQSANIIPVDTDGDGTPDYLDLDSDNEGQPDIVESNFDSYPHTGGRTDASVGINGLDDSFDGPAGDTYTDPNGKHDDSQTDNFPDNDADVLAGGDVDFRDDSFNDFDKDGIADSIDLDDDNDGILDTTESSNAYPPGISRDPLDDDDSDGIPNYMDEDFCPGGLNIHGICSGFDTDGDGFPNHLDLDSDDDGCSDAIEATATTEPTTEFQFPADKVGEYGIPDAVENPSNNRDINYTVKQTYSSTYDFLDNEVFVACKADLSIDKVANKSSVIIGEEVIFTITLTNSGPFSVSKVKVKDELPEGLIYISNNPSAGEYDNVTGIWDLTGVLLGPDAHEETLEITAKIGPNCETIINTAEVLYSERVDPDSIPNNNK
jgi:uncharacterized repeat protein (TIGR01451 family)